MTQSIVHYILHFIFPALIAWVFFRAQWKKAYLIMLATMIVDLDHLFACTDMFPADGGFTFVSIDHLTSCKEIFVPDRCSIGFHPLHSYLAITIYFVLLFFKQTRVVGLGLVFHMLTDFQDCLWM